MTRAANLQRIGHAHTLVTFTRPQQRNLSSVQYSNTVEHEAQTNHAASSAVHKASQTAGVGNTKRSLIVFSGVCYRAQLFLNCQCILSP